jgi:hypothetical protein
MAKKAVENALNDNQIMTLSSVLGRSMLARSMAGGMQFQGKRDMYEVLGYPKNIQWDAYLEKYRRQDIAGKVVDLPPQDTWRKPPKILDGDEDSTMDEVRSPFLQGIRFLVQKRRMWHYLHRLDRLSGVGRYGVMLIGAAEGKPLLEPLEANSLRKPQDVIYLSVFSEGSATVQELVRDTANERYGLPDRYVLQLGQGLGSTVAHWSRTLHVAEDLLEDDIYGMPRLERVYNRLDDLLKLVGGGAEATWKNMDRGLVANAKEGYDIPADEAERLEDEITEYIHGLRRFIRTQGMDITALGSEVIDPKGAFETIIALISAATDIPQRILLGSERGELASSQDQATWAGVIASRQTQHAEPVILRPFIDRLIWAGALPAPTNGEYSVEWETLFELTELEKSQVAERYANAVSKIAPPGAPELVVLPSEFRERYMALPPMEMDERQALDEEDDTEEDETAEGEEPDGTEGALD